MTERVTQIFDSAYWSETYSADIDYLLAELMGKGYPVPNEIVSDFYQRFLHLSLEFKVPDGSQRRIYFSEEAILEQGRIEVQTLSCRANLDLYPAGEVEDSVGLLYIERAGALYVWANRQLYFLGENVFDAIENIANDGELKLTYP
jgi:hypothetical protein